MKNIDNCNYSEITKNIIYAFNRVHSIYGYGFPKSMYEDALHTEFVKMNVSVKKHINVFHEDNLTETFLADFIIDNTLLIELKTGKRIPNENEFEFAKYLNATEIKAALLLNFGKKPEFNYKVFTNENILVFS